MPPSLASSLRVAGLERGEVQLPKWQSEDLKLGTMAPFKSHQHSSTIRTRIYWGHILKKNSEKWCRQHLWPLAILIKLPNLGSCAIYGFAVVFLNIQTENILWRISGIKRFQLTRLALLLTFLSCMTLQSKRIANETEASIFETLSHSCTCICIN